MVAVGLLLKQKSPLLGIDGNNLAPRGPHNAPVETPWKPVWRQQSETQEALRPHRILFCEVTGWGAASCALPSRGSGRARRGPGR